MTRYGAVGRKGRLLRWYVRQEVKRAQRLAPGWELRLCPDQDPPGGFECSRPRWHRGRHISTGTRVPVIHAWPGEYQPKLRDLWRQR